MKNMKDRLFPLLLAIVLLFSLTACSNITDSTTPPREVVAEAEIETSSAEISKPTTYSPDDTWCFYWYLCGSDLESDYGAATADLEEMLEVTLPENVNIIIQTGGALTWQNDVIDPNYLERYVYNSEGLTLMEQLPSANMGDIETLSNFLFWGETNYPADHQVMLFWNHGGGSVGGAAYDELYDFDSLTLPEMYSAFYSVYDLSTEDPPFEMVGFDTCLMATIDTAYTFSDIAKYLTASEEYEPGNGWYYSSWLQSFVENTGIDGGTLGTYICDSYVEGCELEGTQNSITLSVTDLSKLDPLLIAYEEIGNFALSYAMEDPTFLSSFARSALSSENYGGNTDQEGYSNMVDLGSLVENSRDFLGESADTLLAALNDCIVYKVNGAYRTQATGLSCYYPYDKDETNYLDYTNTAASESFTYLYGYELQGTLPNTGIDYISDLGYEELPELPTLNFADLEDAPLSVSDDGVATLSLGFETASYLQSIYMNLCYIDEAEDLILFFGRDNDLYGDWETGIFEDNFQGYWAGIDGYLVYMDITYEGDDYNLYTVPILLNGEEYNLCVAYDYNTATYDILGARKGIDDNGMGDKNLMLLEEGDQITTLHYAMTISGDDEDFQQIPIDTFTYSTNSVFEEIDLGDGLFGMMFEMVDVFGDSYFSQMAYFTVEGENIYTQVE